MNAKSPWIEDTTAEDFQSKVIERSHEVPVLVDFWAAWCGPCRALGPTLEAAVDARQGAVLLCKLDTDANQELAQRFAIRSIPAVKAFYKGAVVQEFVGALDRSAIERFLDGVLPSEGQKLLDEAREALSSKRTEGVAPRLAPLFEDREHGDAARLLAARLHVAEGALDAAREVIEEIAEDGVEGEGARALTTRMELLEAANGVTPEALEATLEADPKAHEARWQLAALRYRSGAFEGALDCLLELLARSRAFRDDGARRAILALFDELGPEHELVSETRRRMQIYL